MKAYPLFRKLLFRIDAEVAHQLTLNLISIAGGIPPVNSLLCQLFSAPTHPVEAFGLTFSNPIGLAAGYDKDGTGWRGLAALGFGHIEIGTVTPKPQAGNPKPRIFRLVSDQAIINRMGFPGSGQEFVYKQIDKPRPKGLVLGVNIGKNKDTPIEQAHEDYLELLRAFYKIADYLAINISSPNTVGLRHLQEKQALSSLLTALNREREKYLVITGKKTPLLVKLAPDLTDTDLDDALEVILDNKIEGVIATNTTLSRQGLNSPQSKENGGLSGLPLFPRSLQMVENIYLRTGGRLPVIGVGGIFNTSGVRKMMDAGAVLVQVYTGLIYQGPGLIQRILTEL